MEKKGKRKFLISTDDVERFPFVVLLSVDRNPFFSLFRVADGGVFGLFYSCNIYCFFLLSTLMDYNVYSDTVDVWPTLNPLKFSVWFHFFWLL